MAAQVQVEVIIGTDGSSEVSVKCGAVGAKCYDITRGIEKALGKKVEDKKTEDFYKQSEIEKERAR